MREVPRPSGASNPAIAARFRLPVQALQPRDFRQRIFHGGNRPEDIYRRISVGIKGTPLPPAGPVSGSSGLLAPEEIRDVVEFVMRG